MPHNRIPVVLLIEDSDDDVLIFRHAFQKSGRVANLRYVNDGVEAVRYMSGIGGFADRITFPIPDLALVDLNMPGMTGHEFVAWLRSRDQFKHVCAVVLSGSPEPRDVAKARELGSNGYLLKPPTPAMICSLLETHRDYWWISEQRGVLPLAMSDGVQF